MIKAERRLEGITGQGGSVDTDALGQKCARRFKHLCRTGLFRVCSGWEESDGEGRVQDVMDLECHTQEFRFGPKGKRKPFKFLVCLSVCFKGVIGSATFQKDHTGSYVENGGGCRGEKQKESIKIN